MSNCHECQRYQMTGRTLDAIKAEHVALGFVFGILFAMPALMVLRWLIVGQA